MFGDEEEVIELSGSSTLRGDALGLAGLPEPRSSHGISLTGTVDSRSGRDGDDDCRGFSFRPDPSPAPRQKTASCAVKAQVLTPQASPQQLQRLREVRRLALVKVPDPSVPLLVFSSFTRSADLAKSSCSPHRVHQRLLPLRPSSEGHHRRLGALCAFPPLLRRKFRADLRSFVHVGSCVVHQGRTRSSSHPRWSAQERSLPEDVQVCVPLSSLSFLLHSGSPLPARRCWTLCWTMTVAADPSLDA